MNWKVGQKISTVLNWPKLSEQSVPMHILLEVTEVVMMEGTFVPRCKAIGISPIDDQQQIIRLLNDNSQFPPNRLRLMMKEYHDLLNEATQGLNYFQSNLIEFSPQMTAESAKQVTQYNTKEQMKKSVFGTKEK